MRKKGFTLVELLAVVVLMAILITVAVPGVMRISKSLKVQSYCSKISVIESAALEYANDYYSEQVVTSNNRTSLDNISLIDLVNLGYLDSDNPIKKEGELTEDELKDKNNGKQFCILYDKNSNCLVDPRNDNSMDYNLVRIWSVNKRLYASFRYQSADVYNEELTAGVCGDKSFYDLDKSDLEESKTIIYTSTDLGSFGDTNIASKPMVKNKYNWSNYKNFRITRPDNIPGNYYISNLKIEYEVGNDTRVEITSGDLFTKDDITSSDTLDIALNNNHLSNIDISYRVALNSLVRKENAYGKIKSISVTWQKLS